jgi:hypothetical protein
MAITIKHAKTDNIADWTQADLDAQIAAGNYPPGTVLADIVLPSDWNNSHTLSGTVPVANGGTGQTTATDAINALLPTQATNTGKVLTTDGTNTSWVTNGSGTVTSVTGTAPVSVATGTTTPVISMAAATTSVNGYLTSTDWNTFNGKGSGSVTSVGGTGTVSGISLSGTVTSSGNLTLGGTLDLSVPPAIGGTTPNTGAFTWLFTNSSTSTTPVLTFNASNSNFASGATISGSYLQNVLQNKSGTAGASTNYVLSNDLGTDSTYYGEFGMNSSVYTSGTPADFFSINNGVYFSSHDGDVTIGSGNGYKTYFAWGTAGQSAHVINASGAIGLNTSATGATNFGTSGQVLTSGGSTATPTWTTPTTGTVTSVGISAPSIFTVTNSPVISSGTLTLTYSGTALPIANGGTNATTAAAANANLQGFTTTATSATPVALTNTSTYYQYFTGTLTQTITLPLNTDIKNGWSFHIANNSTGNLTVNSNSGALVATIIPQTTQHVTCVDATVNTAAAWDSGTTDFGSVTGTGAVVLATSPTLVTPALGTPASGVVTNLTGTASININGTVGATTATTGKFTTLEMTSVTDASSIARNTGLSANTTVTNQATFTTAGLTLASQTPAAGSIWRIRAYGQFVAASSATVRTAQIACFWGTTQLTAITPTVLASAAQTTQWQVEFELVATSATAMWTTGSLMSRIASATALAIDNATPASTTISGAQTIDLRVRVSTAVAAESWVIQQVTMERLK